MSKKKKVEIRNQHLINTAREVVSSVGMIFSMHAGADEKLTAFNDAAASIGRAQEATTRALLMAEQVLPDLTSGLQQALDAIKRLQEAQKGGILRFADAPIELPLDSTTTELNNLLRACERLRVFLADYKPDIVTAVGSLAPK